MMAVKGARGQRLAYPCMGATDSEGRRPAEGDDRSRPCKLKAMPAIGTDDFASLRCPMGMKACCSGW